MQISYLNREWIPLHITQTEHPKSATFICKIQYCFLIRIMTFAWFNPCRHNLLWCKQKIDVSCWCCQRSSCELFKWRTHQHIPASFQSCRLSVWSLHSRQVQTPRWGSMATLPFWFELKKQQLECTLIAALHNPWLSTWCHHLLTVKRPIWMIGLCRFHYPIREAHPGYRE